MSIIIGVITAGILIMLLLGLQRLRIPGYETQLSPFGEPQEQPAERTAYERRVRPLAVWLAKNVDVLRGMSDPVKIAQKLNYAGNPSGITANEFYGVQLYTCFAGLIVSLAYLYIGLPLAQVVIILLPIGGFFYPVLWLRGKVRRRQHAISVALPDLLDMLAVCVRAGMGFDIALKLLHDRNEGPLQEEIARLLREIQIGEPRQHAFYRVSQRNSSEPLRSFIDALLQAEELGTPIADMLERQAEDIRIKRRHEARSKGAQAASKIALVIIFVVVPSVACLMIGGLVLMMQRNGGAILGG